MKRKLFTLIYGFLLLPKLAYCQNSGEKIFWDIVLLVISEKFTEPLLQHNPT